MKFRSPSPSTALPTPPRSPATYEQQPSAVNLLDSLQTFYQQERYWVHNTRASLELALAKGIDAPPLAAAAASPSSSVTSSPDSGSINSGVSDPVSIKTEPTTPPPMDPIAARQSLYMRRKAGMKLKLDSLAPLHRRRRPLRASPSEPSARLLEMFSELVDARMESCERISRLVRDTNKPDFV
ncbi:hypothetical protein C8Q75DRAFT_202428 [Abortiporus biennis]|nr:hypothetical protein C8Q75DRAFT_202428 [Abortiporus biennis]